MKSLREQLKDVEVTSYILNTTAVSQVRDNYQMVINKRIKMNNMSAMLLGEIAEEIDDNNLKVRLQNVINELTSKEHRI